MDGREVREAACVLPKELAGLLDRLDKGEMNTVEEFRLRRGRSMAVSMKGRELSLGGPIVREEHLYAVLESASSASAHTVLGQVKNGFVTLKGGHRIGLCGTVSHGERGLVTMRYLSSLSVRIAREIKGPAVNVLPGLIENSRPLSTLILSPPGGGKTTLLRDLVRCLSDSGIRVAVADERGEIAALWQGEPQMDVGCCTDVLDGCSKGEAMTVLLRGMTPEVIAVDEITDRGDASAAAEVCGCGVALFATAHGCSETDLKRRTPYRLLLEQRVFRRLLILERTETGRTIRMEVLD